MELASIHISLPRYLLTYLHNVPTNTYKCAPQGMAEPVSMRSRGEKDMYNAGESKNEINSAPLIESGRPVPRPCPKTGKCNSNARRLSHNRILTLGTVDARCRTLALQAQAAGCGRATCLFFPDSGASRQGGTTSQLTTHTPRKRPNNSHSGRGSCDQTRPKSCSTHFSRRAHPVRYASPCHRLPSPCNPHH